MRFINAQNDRKVLSSVAHYGIELQCLPCMALYGIVWPCMVLCCFLRPCLTLCVWSFMASLCSLYGLLWQNIVFSRGHRSKLWLAICDHLGLLYFSIQMFWQHERYSSLLKIQFLFLFRVQNNIAIWKKLGFLSPADIWI